MKGIDVSTFQKKIDWQKVRSSGIEFAMLRAGFGNNNIDEQFIRNAEECNRLGIPIGVYWFSYAYTTDMAKREANQCLETIKPFKIDFPAAFDFEYDSVEYAEKKGVIVTKTKATSFTAAFCEKVKKAGYTPMIYANNDYMANYYDMSKLKDYDLWYAYPTGNPDKDRSKKCHIWQYTFTGRVNGITGNVDLNISYKDYRKDKNENRSDKLFTRVLRFGDEGKDVGQAQRLLKILGYYDGPIDNRYGPGEGFKNAVLAFQAKEKLGTDGNIGTKTQERMTDIILDKAEEPGQDPALAQITAEQEKKLKKYRDFFSQMKSYLKDSP